MTTIEMAKAIQKHLAEQIKSLEGVETSDLSDDELAELSGKVEALIEMQYFMFGLYRKVLGLNTDKH